jgi:hypothetical protein
MVLSIGPIWRSSKLSISYMEKLKPLIEEQNVYIIANVRFTQ